MYSVYLLSKICLKCVWSSETLKSDKWKICKKEKEKRKEKHCFSIYIYHSILDLFCFVSLSMELKQLNLAVFQLTPRSNEMYIAFSFRGCYTVSHASICPCLILPPFWLCVLFLPSQLQLCLSSAGNGSVLELLLNANENEETKQSSKFVIKDSVALKTTAGNLSVLAAPFTKKLFICWMHNRNAELYELGTLFRSFFWNMQTLLHDHNKIRHRTIPQVFRVIWGQLLYMYCKVQMSLRFTSCAFPALWLKADWKNFLWLSDMMIAGIHEPQMHLSSCLPHPLRGISSICMASLFSGLRGLPWRRRTTDFLPSAVSASPEPPHRCGAEF